MNQSYIAPGIASGNMPRSNRPRVSSLDQVGRRKIRSGRNSRLSDDDVRAIRARYDAADDHSAIAADYGVYKSHVSAIGRRKARTGVSA